MNTVFDIGSPSSKAVCCFGFIENELVLNFIINWAQVPTSEVFHFDQIDTILIFFNFFRFFFVKIEHIFFVENQNFPRKNIIKM